MATAEKFDSTRKEDRLAATWALAAGSRGSAGGPCLSAEEIAELVEGACSSSQRAARQAHLAECEDCYGVWLAVSTTLNDSQHSKKKAKILPLFKPRNLTYLGSALAIAASVVVFWNIRDSAFRQLIYEAPPTPRVQQEQVAETAVDVESGQSRELEKKSGSVPGRQFESDAGTLTERPAVRPQLIEPTMRKESVVPPAAFMDSAVETTAQQPAAAPATSPASLRAAAEQEALPGAAEAWLQLVVTHCRAGETDPGFWARVQRQGSEIAAGADLPTTQRVRLIRVLEVLQAAAGVDAIPEQCQQVLAYLAKEGESR